tara:strand:- start:34 stop:516 length:483 start_codon:yes stop_codon:yes gene_type:complete
MAGIKLTNLNYNLDGPQDKAVKGGKSAAGFFTGPTRTAQNFVQPNPEVTEFIKNNPKTESFYDMFETPEALQAQEDINNRTGFYGNTFEGQNNAQAQAWLGKYLVALGGPNTAQGKGLIEPDRIVEPENLRQLSSQPATDGGGVQDPNVAGRFPSNSVAV